MSAGLAPGVGRERDWGGFAATFGGAAASVLALGLAVTIAIDPFWVFRERPPWLAWTGGVNRHLDIEMRRAKPLQLFARPTDTVFVGSSTVLRGLRPSDCPGARVYNLGLSSMMADELPALADLIAARGGVGRVVIGLDYFAFTAFPGPPRLDPSLAETRPRLAAWVKAALSLRALVGSLPFVIRRAYEPGAWQADGFKTTPDYPAPVTQRIAAEQNFGVMRYRPETLEFLSEAVKRLAGLDVSIYLSPMTPPQRDLAAAAGRDHEMARWRADTAELAARRGARFADLIDVHPFTEFDPAGGSSARWLDNLHFKPEVGRWILDRLGLCTA